MIKRMSRLSKWRLILAGAITLFAAAIPFLVYAKAMEEGGTDVYSSPLYGTFWALVPPLVAIILALITKEVFSSLFIGILIGGVFWASGPDPGFAVTDDNGAITEITWQASNMFSGTFNHIVKDGFLAQLTDGWNIGIVIFLAILGMMVVMMDRVGGVEAFGKWAGRTIKTRVGAQLSLMVFHLFIFIDDYFSCLTVGAVMRPVTANAKVSRAKLSYLIDGTAAPICILAPISTWAAAVASYIPEDSDINGFTMFVRAIPYNFYAILTIVMILVLVIFKFDYGPMAKYEKAAAETGDLGPEGSKIDSDTGTQIEKKGKVFDLIIPILFLIGSCVLSLIYTGGFFEGESFVDAFANADAATGLVIGALFSIVFMILYYVCRRILIFKELTDLIPKGLNAMSAPILILSFAWTLNTMTRSLGSREFVTEAMKGAEGIQNFLPAIVFIVACLIAFSTGTSWGTYAILIPIVVSVFEGVDANLLVIGIAACLAGGVCGDHCSPISDTTIMASAGANSNHITHVSTQLPYAATVAVFSFVMYIIAGFVRSPIVLPIAIVLFVALLFGIRATIGVKTVETK